MYIKAYKSKRFAGLKDIDLEFKKGLNVVLGPNESGKSSIIEGIHSTLFKDIRLKKNNNKDKNFVSKFMPKPKGDYIDGKVELESNKGNYEISKEWGSKESIQLKTPEGNILGNEKEVKKELNKILNFGESTYSNIVFAKQRYLKEALTKIIENPNVTQEVNDILRMTLMELDGVSIDTIEKNIKEEIDNLYARWNKDKNYPENNRGVNNPYKTGLGKILESYYHKENLMLKMKLAEKTELTFEEVNKNIKEAKDNMDKFSTEKNNLDNIEEDMNSRAILDVEINSLNKELETLKSINKKWPLTEEKIEHSNKEAESLKQEKEELNKEKENIDKANKKIALQKKLDKVEEVSAKTDVLLKELKLIPIIKEEDVKELLKFKSEIATLKTTMQAGKMFGKLKKSGQKDVFISKDFNDKTVLKLNEEFQADGVVQISYGNELELEIKTGKIDFKKLNNDYKEVQSKLSKMLEQLEIESVEMGENNLKRITTKENELSNLNRELKMVLEDSSKEDIISEIDALKDVQSYRDLKAIENDLKNLSEKEVNLLSEIKNMKSNIKKWVENYENHSELLDILLDQLSSLKIKKAEREKLEELPDEFESVQDFKDRLSYLKSEIDTLNKELDNLNSQFYEAKDNLLNDTYEELNKEYLDIENEFKRNINKGKKLLEIQKVFIETKERLSQNPMQPLADEFTRLLEIITEGRYYAGDIDEKFNISLENKNGEIPIEILSAGTYDAVTLALRFSLIKHIFSDIGGYVVLDDVLVDMDPQRSAQSIKLINDFAKDFQIIFTTCHPKTAEMLGGNLIELS